MSEGLQPFLHDSIVALRAPAQVWSGRDGRFTAPIDGVYVSDVRVARDVEFSIGGSAGEHIATMIDDSSTVRFVSLQRSLDGPGADPDVRVTITRRVLATGVEHELALDSRLDREVVTEVEVRLVPDATSMELIKSGRALTAATVEVATGADSAWWGDGTVSAELTAGGAELSAGDDGIRMRWPLSVPPRGSAQITFSIEAVDRSAVVAAATGPAPWREPRLSGADDRLARWVRRALDDLDALRLTTTSSPDEFLAAGAPWFFTLFGRDSIWAARFLLPLGPGIAGSTLRVLARLQGRQEVTATAEQPGKIMHELRRGALELPDEGITLPPLYYGTVDATPLWICLLADARDAGLPDDDVLPLLPHLEAALAWMRDDGDADGDGLLEYADATGRGLSNQGWKDSGDSIQWRDGRLAEGPIALCEVQGYAYEAATRGAVIMQDFGLDGDEWVEWAARLAARFRESFWIPDAAGAYPAVALDSSKRPVDTVTSNIGHLLGTGLLDAPERALVARRLVSPALNSGFGLRTMSTDSAGYWPLAYHGGSVWTHDTAIAITGLTRDGFRHEAAELAEGLLRAAVAFDYRMPELHSGDAAADAPRPAPYPAACRPQAWSAAAAIAVLEALKA